MNVPSKKAKIKIFIKSIFISGLLLFIFIILFRISKNIQFDINKNGKLYWLFSATSQSIATFFAFLLAGYGFFNSNLNEIRTEDETLDEIIEEEKKIIFKYISILSIIVGVSLLLNLTMIFVNGIEIYIKSFLFLATFLLSIITIIFGVIIIIIIISPNKNKRIAGKLIYRNKDYGQNKILKGQAEFINNFIELEKILRNYAESHDLSIYGMSRKVQSLFKIIQVLHYKEVITNKEYEQLIEINKYRNLIVHGQLENASEKMINLLNSTLQDIKLKIVYSN